MMNKVNKNSILINRKSMIESSKFAIYSTLLSTIDKTYPNSIYSKSEFLKSVSGLQLTSEMSIYFKNKK